MNFLKTDYGWVSDDALKLCFHSEQPPDNVEAHRIGHGSCYNGYPGVRVFLKEAIMHRAVEFGPARPSSVATDTKWSGDSYRFGLCSLPDRHRVLIIEINGSGNFFYLWDQHDALVMWTTLLRQIPEPQLWDLLHGLIGTWQNGTHTERNRLYAMVAAGKLQRRKIRDQHVYRCVERR